MSINAPHNQAHSESFTVSNVDTDANGQFTITFTKLRRIDGPSDVEAQASGGFVANCVSVSGNTATFELRQSAQGGTSAAPLPLVTGATDVTDIHATAVHR